MNNAYCLRYKSHRMGDVRKEEDNLENAHCIWWRRNVCVFYNIPSGAQLTRPLKNRDRRSMTIQNEIPTQAPGDHGTQNVFFWSCSSSGNRILRDYVVNTRTGADVPCTKPSHCSAPSVAKFNSYYPRKGVCVAHAAPFDMGVDVSFYWCYLINMLRLWGTADCVCQDADFKYQILAKTLQGVCRVACMLCKKPIK